MSGDMIFRIIFGWMGVAFAICAVGLPSALCGFDRLNAAAGIAFATWGCMSVAALAIGLIVFAMRGLP